MLADDSSKCEKFAQFFKSAFIVDDGQLPDFPVTCRKILENINIDCALIKNAILSLNDKLSITPEIIPSYFLKRVVDTVVYPLSLIFKHSFVVGSLPSYWKTAIVSPLLKKKPSSSIINYRPISLTSSICKVFELILKNALTTHFVKNSLLNPDQYGFQKRKSTLLQLLSSTTDWYANLNEKAQTDIIYIDYAKAFDTVSHPKLLMKLERYGVKGSLLLWIKNFLQGRTFRVKIADCDSHYFDVTSGVPQGSILGPFLFLVYVNDASWHMSSSCKLFADDVKIYRKISDPIIDFYMLQQDLDSLAQWSNKWQLKISTSKCFLLHINFLHECFLKVEGNKITACNTVRDLGVYVNCDLKWREHCKQIVKKASVVSNCILRSMRYSCVENYRKAFIAFCRTILEYCSAVWSPSAAADIAMIENVQKRFTRIAFSKVYPGSDKPSYQERRKIFNLESLEYRRLFLDLCLCYQIVHNLTDVTPTDMFTFQTSHISLRRHRFSMIQRKTSSSKVQNSFAFRVVSPWNSLPKNIVESINFPRFKSALKQFDLSVIKHLKF